MTAHFTEDFSLNAAISHLMGLSGALLVSGPSASLVGSRGERGLLPPAGWPARSQAGGQRAVPRCRLLCVTLLSFFFFKILFYLFIFREGKGRRKRKRETSMCGWLPLTGPPLGTQACAPSPPSPIFGGEDAEAQGG